MERFKMEYFISIIFKIENLAILTASLVITAIGCIFYSFQPAGFSGYIATGLFSLTFFTSMFIKFAFKKLKKKFKNKDLCKAGD